MNNIGLKLRVNKHVKISDTKKKIQTKDNDCALKTLLEQKNQAKIFLPNLAKKHFFSKSKAIYVQMQDKIQTYKN